MNYFASWEIRKSYSTLDNDEFPLLKYDICSTSDKARMLSRQTMNLGRSIHGDAGGS